MIYRICQSIFRRLDYFKHECLKREWIRNGLQIGVGSYIRPDVKIYNPEKVQIGNKVHINENCHLINGPIVIGNNVTLSPNVCLVASGYEQAEFKKGQRIHLDAEEIYIGDYNWICTGAMILPGVKLTGNHVIVAANAVVTKSFEESNIILAGVPARIIGYVKGEINESE